jgi:hypothetical protein
MNTLKPSSSRLRPACGLFFGIPLTLVACIFLTGAAVSLIEDPARNIFPAAPIIITSAVFTAIGLAIVVASVIPWIAGMRVARPEITLSSSTLRVGDGFSVHYAQTFKKQTEVNGIRLLLILREQATYRRGTDTTTVRHEQTAAEFEFPAKVYETGEQISFSRSMDIPRNGMHTFRGLRNQITWQLRVKVDIAGWPDYSEDFELYVQPSAGR